MDNEIRYTINENIGIELPKNMELMTFQRLFTYLRKKLKIKYTRKIHIDSILKKCKAKFYKAINDCLKLCLTIKVRKIPQKFITNISIDYNKGFLHFQMINLYNYFRLIPYPLEIILNKQYYVEGKENYLKYILLSKVHDLYSIYTKSKRYKRELESIKKIKGQKIAFLYQFVSDNLMNYYMYSKPHTKKNKS